MNRVDGKVALVTGAGRGLGEAAARLLAEAGATVVITDLQTDAATRLAREIADQAGRADAAHALGHDVTSEDDWQRVIDTVTGRCGGIDVLVNNAGVALTGTIAETTLETWRKVVSVNLDGVFLGMKCVLPAMRPRTGQWEGGGSVINISSILGLVGSPGAASYAASKGGVRLLTKTAALEFGRLGYGIRVNSVHPGYIETAMFDYAVTRQVERGLVGTTEEGRQRLQSMHPIGRIGKPIDVARAVLWLASAASSFTTGSEVVVDGGYTAQ